MERNSSSCLEENLEANLGSNKEGSMEDDSSKLKFKIEWIYFNRFVTIGSSLEEDLEAKMGWNSSASCQRHSSAFMEAILGSRMVRFQKN